MIKVSRRTRLFQVLFSALILLAPLIVQSAHAQQQTSGTMTVYMAPNAIEGNSCVEEASPCSAFAQIAIAVENTGVIIESLTIVMQPGEYFSCDGTQLAIPSVVLLGNGAQFFCPSTTFTNLLIFNGSSFVQISGLSVVGGSSTLGGGAIVWLCSSPSVSTSKGSNLCSFSVFNSTFSNNSDSSPNGGGALYLELGAGIAAGTVSITFENCIFMANSAYSSSGGGICVRHLSNSTSTSITVSDSIFSLNTADASSQTNQLPFGGGGAAAIFFAEAVNSGIIQFNNCSFQDNYLNEGSGGAIGLFLNSSGADIITNISKSNFINNYCTLGENPNAFYGGGAVGLSTLGPLTNARFSFSSNEFYSNIVYGDINAAEEINAYASGGAVSFLITGVCTFCSTSVAGDTYRKNSAWSSGGAYGGAFSMMYLADAHNCSSQILDAEFASNNCSGGEQFSSYGGAHSIFVNGNSVNFTQIWTNNNFLANQNSAVSGGAGGALSSFAYGTSQSGMLILRSNNFTNNTCFQCGSGGGASIAGISMSAALHIVSENNTFKGNSLFGTNSSLFPVLGGGGLSVFLSGGSECNVQVHGDVYSVNRASAQYGIVGGGLSIRYANDANNCSNSLGNSVFQGNRADIADGPVESSSSCFGGGFSLDYMTVAVYCLDNMTLNRFTENRVVHGFGGAVSILVQSIVQKSKLTMQQNVQINNYCEGGSQFAFPFFGGGATSILTGGFDTQAAVSFSIFSLGNTYTNNQVSGIDVRTFVVGGGLSVAFYYGCTGCKTTVSGDRYENNTAAFNGGGGAGGGFNLLYWNNPASGCSSSISHSTFSNNSVSSNVSLTSGTTSYGGGANIDYFSDSIGCMDLVTSSSFSANSATNGFGGGFSVLLSAGNTNYSLQLTDNNFTSNMCQGGSYLDFYGGGGANLISGSQTGFNISVVSRQNQYVGNSVQGTTVKQSGGGGLSIFYNFGCTGCTANVTGDVFEDNSATSPGNNNCLGGGFNLLYDNNAMTSSSCSMVQGCTFVNNSISATVLSAYAFGGGMSVYYASQPTGCMDTATSNIFTNNSVFNGLGGGLSIGVNSASGYTVNISSNNFTANTINGSTVGFAYGSGASVYTVGNQASSVMTTSYGNRFEGNTIRSTGENCGGGGLSVYHYGGCTSCQTIVFGDVYRSNEVASAAGAVGGGFSLLYSSNSINCSSIVQESSFLGNTVLCELYFKTDVNVTALGGGVSILYSYADAVNCSESVLGPLNEFKNNYASNGFGGAYSYYASQIAVACSVCINSSLFEYNLCSSSNLSSSSSIQNGGAVSIWFQGDATGSHVNDTGSVYIGNRASDQGTGGALQVTFASSMQDCTTFLNGIFFLNNTAPQGYGGAFMALYKKYKGQTALYVRKCVFTNSFASLGGHIFLEVVMTANFLTLLPSTSLAIQITDCTFKNGASDSMGGAILILNTGDDNTFGGLPRFVGLNLTISNCNFSQCQSAVGGAVALSIPSATVSSLSLTCNTFVENFASNGVGGAVAITSLIPTFTSGNRAASSESEFDCFASTWEDVEVEMKNNVYNSNHASAGGALSLGLRSVKCNGSTLFELEDETFSLNTATSTGGATYMRFEAKSFCSVRMTLCCLGENSALTGGGIYATGDVNLLIADTLFQDNNGTFASAVYLEGSGEVSSPENNTAAFSVSNITVNVSAEIFKTQPSVIYTSRLFNISGTSSLDLTTFCHGGKFQGQQPSKTVVEEPSVTISLVLNKLRISGTVVTGTLYSYDANCIYCASGSFQSDECPSKPCLSCAKFSEGELVCNGASDVENEPGIWICEGMSCFDELRTYECPEGFCEANGNCAEGRANFKNNTLCGACDAAGNYSQVGNSCVKCEPSDAVLRWILVILGSMAYVLLLLFLAARAGSTAKKKILFYFFQSLQLVLGPASSWASWLYIFNLSVVRYTCIHDANGNELVWFRLLSPILFAVIWFIFLVSHWLWRTRLTGSGNTKFLRLKNNNDVVFSSSSRPHRASTIFMHLLDGYERQNHDSDQGAWYHHSSSNISNDEQKQQQQLSVSSDHEPVATDAPIQRDSSGNCHSGNSTFRHHSLHSHNHMQEGSLNRKYRFLRAFFFVALMTYEQFCEISFQLFNCISVCDTHILAEYPTVKCRTDQFLHSLFIISVLLAVYAVLFPCMIAFKVKRVVIESKREDGPGEEVAKARFGIFYDHFEERCWWWESQTCVRRVLLLTAYVVNFSDLQNRQYWVAIVCLCTLAMHVAFRPYRESQDNFLEGVALFTLVFASLTMVYSSSPSSETTKAMHGIIIAVLAIVGVAAIFEFIHTYSRTFKGTMRTVARSFSNIRNNNSDGQVAESHL